MNTTHQSTPRRTLRPRATVAGLLAAVVLGAMLGASSYAAMYHPPTNAPGGVPAQAVLGLPTAITTSNANLCWYGMQGWYTVEMSTNGGAPPWTPVGRTAASDHAWCLTVTNGGFTSAQFRLNQLNAYVGSGACSGCHGDKYSEWVNTEHASAFDDITNEIAQADELVYRTVGHGQPTGFIASTNTAYLGNAGCENCHGPAAWHKYSDHDLIRPAVSIDPKVCGGCHRSEGVGPTFEEYELSPHSEVNGDIRYGTATPGVYYSHTIPWFTSNLYGFLVTTNADLTLKTNATTGILHSQRGNPNNLYDPGQDRAMACGHCHSGAARMAMLKDYEARLEGYTNALVLPTTSDEALWGPTCAVCHDPHSAENDAQLRNPLWSTNYYTMATTTDRRTIINTNFMGVKTTNVVFYSAAFANLYDPNIQVCGQCHNSRGSRWDGRGYGYYNSTTLQTVTSPGSGIVYGVTTNISYARPPHHSPQYNIFSGNVQPDYLTGVYGTNYIGCHTLNTKGCAACHMHKEESPVYTGHTFEPELGGCSVAGCHDGVTTPINATNAIVDLQLEVTNKIEQMVVALNNWAIVKGTNVFGAVNAAKYKENGWEYTIPGDLRSITNAGPSSSDQLKITNLVRQARFNLYMVAYGKSLGIHNPQYTRYLLDDASNKVWIATQP